jgi:hypothetical protein
MAKISRRKELHTMKRYCLIFSLALLTACATTAKYERNLNSWLGADEVSLVRQWGAPQQAYETGGSKFLVYSSNGNIVLPGQAPAYTTNVYGNTAYTTPVGGYPAQNIALDCVTTFEVANGVVSNWTWKGNNCVAE